MKYYRLQGSSQLSVIGKYPQVSNGKFVSTWNSENSLLMVFKKKTNSSKVEVPDLILDKKAKITDLVSTSFLDLKIVVSSKLKAILSAQNYLGIEFLKTRLHYKDHLTEDFWIVNPFEFKNEYIKFDKSTIQCSGKDGISYTVVHDINEFNNLYASGRSNMKMYTIHKLTLNNEKIVNNFFVLEGVSGGFGYYVSDNLKNEIQEAGCTGIQFEEV